MENSSAIPLHTSQISIVYSKINKIWNIKYLSESNKCIWMRFSLYFVILGFCGNIINLNKSQSPLQGDTSLAKSILQFER